MAQPNILLLFTDQQRFDTIEALGNPIIKTPALNQLVERGIAFTRAYSPCPVCVPARYGMLTGRMPHRSGCVDNEPTQVRTSLMQILSKAGYQTHGVGKMHFNFEHTNNTTELWGFDSRDTSEEVDGEDDFRKYLDETGYTHVCDAHGMRSDMYYIPQPSQLPAERHQTTWVVDKSIQFLERRNHEKPFFLMSSFIKPHPPFESPTPWNKLYRGPEMPLPKRPEGMEHLLTLWNKFQNRYKYRDQGIDNNLIRSMIAAYYSAISFIDYNLSRLFEYMESTGLMENTVIVFASDHGELLGDYNSFGKRCFVDSASRIPMLMYYPGCIGRTVCRTPVSLNDLLPTFLDFAGLQAGEEYAGKSLRSIAKGCEKRDTVFGQFQRGGLGMYMAVTEAYKYIYSAPDNKEWLFDLRTDPEETRNKAENPLYVKKKEEMRKKLIDYFREEGYEEPLEGDGWKRYPYRDIPSDPDAFLLFQDAEASIPHTSGYETDMNTKKYYKDGWYKPTD